MSRRADADKVPPSKLGSTAEVEEEADMMMPSTSAERALRAPAAQRGRCRRCLLAVTGLSIAESVFCVCLYAWSSSPSAVPEWPPVHVSFPDRKQCELAALYSPAQGRDGGWRRGDPNGLAMRESGGFFDEPEELWRLRRMRHIQQRCRQAESLRACPAPAWIKDCWPGCRGASPAKCPGGSFWQIHYEPTFSCDAELRIGLQGEGGKWVCDPHKITAAVAAGRACLVYSIGSNGMYDFESAVHGQISPACEIHTFDMKNWSAYTAIPPPRFVNYHIRKIGPPPAALVSILFRELGHEGRTLDLLKIDCEGCEWETYRSWLGEGMRVRQILVELHGFSRAHELFSFLNEMGYVIAYKEPNTLGCDGSCIEYVFVMLNRSFSRAVQV